MQTPASRSHGRPSVIRDHHGRSGRSRLPVPVEDHGGHGADDEQGDERVEHANPRVHEVEEVDRQQPGGGDGPHRRTTPCRDAAQEAPSQEVHERDTEGSGHRDGDAPSERLIAEGGNARADEPLAERRM